ncbi:MAG: hypothetical protein P1V21_09515 [Rhizobiaceae bacterium]|nr:hypothetical protein [Rhizobiaceae bacterium]
MWPGKIVLPGSGAPELGGLAPVANHTLKPSVQIDADLVGNLLLTMIIDTMSGSAYPFSAVRRAEPVMGNGLEQRLRPRLRRDWWLNRTYSNSRVNSARRCHLLPISKAFQRPLKSSIRAT